MTRHAGNGDARASDAPILSARDLVKDYVTASQTTRALDGVSLDVPSGRFLAVMGPSGSGKSTLLHLLGGLDVPTSGEVLLDGRALSSLADRDATLARRGRVGFVFQFFNLVPVLSVAENIALPLVIEGHRPSAYDRRLQQLVRLVGLEDCSAKLPSEISGGQQQRAAVARALITRPAVMLADEPTGNLDTKTGDGILRLLRAAQRKLGQTVVMVTHDPRAAAHGDEIVFIRDGRIDANLALNGRRSRTSKRRTTAAERMDERAQTVLAWLQELGA
jgi:putative ABC transport system ATP-binding protein